MKNKEPKENYDYSFQKFILGMATKTWNKEVNGLFNYESHSCQKAKLFFEENGEVIRTKGKISKCENFKEEDNQKNNNEFSSKNFNLSELLFSVIKEDNNFFISKQFNYNQNPSLKSIDSISNNLWYVLNSETKKKFYKSGSKYNEDYFLNKNDIIKIGKIKFSFNEFNIDGIDKIKYENKENSYNLSLLNSKTDPLFNMIYDAERVDLNNNEKIICNICYSDENTEENPLINLCHCNGGMKFSHFNCIKLWIKTKLIIKENSRKNVKSYNFTSFNCKICKTPFPFKFRIKDKNNNMNKIYSLIDIEKPEFENYLVLESLDQINENNNFKTIHVITLNEENFIIGRGHECDIRINDISVSRVHAILHFDMIRKLLLLRDLKSKFGTLVLVKKPIKILKKYIRLQIGRTFIETKLVDEDDVKDKIEEEKNEEEKNESQNEILIINECK
jgi:hypothetical protein